MEFQADKIPWPQIYDFLMEMGSERSVSEFVLTLYGRLGSLIPSDLTVCTSFYDLHHLDVKEVLGLPEKTREEFVRLSRNYPPEIPTSGSINWNYYLHTEFAADFMKPLGIQYSIGNNLIGLPGHSIHFSLHRSPRHLGFTEPERAIMEVLFPQLKNIYAYLMIITGLTQENINTIAEATSGCKILSKREAEVAALLCKRMSPAEIATLLFISPRTVERHIANIYEKLKVKNRRELILKLLPEK